MSIYFQNEVDLDTMVLMKENAMDYQVLKDGSRTEQRINELVPRWETIDEFVEQFPELGDFRKYPYGDVESILSDMLFTPQGVGFFYQGHQSGREAQPIQWTKAINEITNTFTDWQWMTAISNNAVMGAGAENMNILRFIREPVITPEEMGRLKTEYPNEYRRYLHTHKNQFFFLKELHWRNNDNNQIIQTRPYLRKKLPNNIDGKILIPIFKKDTLKEVSYLVDHNGYETYIMFVPNEDIVYGFSDGDTIWQYHRDPERQATPDYGVIRDPEDESTRGGTYFSVYHRTQLIPSFRHNRVVVKDVFNGVSLSGVIDPIPDDFVRPPLDVSRWPLLNEEYKTLLAKARSEIAYQNAPHQWLFTIWFERDTEENGHSWFGLLSKIRMRHHRLRRGSYDEHESDFLSYKVDESGKYNNILDMWGTAEELDTREKELEAQHRKIHSVFLKIVTGWGSDLLIPMIPTKREFFERTGVRLLPALRGLEKYWKDHVDPDFQLTVKTPINQNGSQWHRGDTHEFLRGLRSYLLGLGNQFRQDLLKYFRHLTAIYNGYEHPISINEYLRVTNTPSSFAFSANILESEPVYCYTSEEYIRLMQTDGQYGNNWRRYFLKEEDRVSFGSLRRIPYEKLFARIWREGDKPNPGYIDIPLVSGTKPLLPFFIEPYGDYGVNDYPSEIQYFERLTEGKLPTLFQHYFVGQYQDTRNTYNNENDSNKVFNKWRDTSTAGGNRPTADKFRFRYRHPRLPQGSLDLGDYPVLNDPTLPNFSPAPDEFTGHDPLRYVDDIDTLIKNNILGYPFGLTKEYDTTETNRWRFSLFAALPTSKWDNASHYDTTERKLKVVNFDKRSSKYDKDNEDVKLPAVGTHSIYSRTFPLEPLPVRYAFVHPASGGLTMPMIYHPKYRNRLARVDVNSKRIPEMSESDNDRFYPTLDYNWKNIIKHAVDTGIDTSHVIFNSTTDWNTEPRSHIKWQYELIRSIGLGLNDSQSDSRYNRYLNGLLQIRENHSTNAESVPSNPFHPEESYYAVLIGLPSLTVNSFTDYALPFFLEEAQKHDLDFTKYQSWWETVKYPWENVVDTDGRGFHNTRLGRAFIYWLLAMEAYPWRYNRKLYVPEIFFNYVLLTGTTAKEKRKERALLLYDFAIAVHNKAVYQDHSKDEDIRLFVKQFFNDTIRFWKENTPPSEFSPVVSEDETRTYDYWRFGSQYSPESTFHPKQGKTDLPAGSKIFWLKQDGEWITNNQPKFYLSVNGTLVDGAPSGQYPVYSDRSVFHSELGYLAGEDIDEDWTTRETEYGKRNFWRAYLYLCPVEFKYSTQNRYLAFPLFINLLPPNLHPDDVDAILTYQEWDVRNTELWERNFPPTKEGIQRFIDKVKAVKDWSTITGNVSRINHLNANYINQLMMYPNEHTAYYCFYDYFFEQKNDYIDSTHQFLNAAGPDDFNQLYAGGIERELYLRNPRIGAPFSAYRTYVSPSTYRTTPNLALIYYRIKELFYSAAWEDFHYGIERTNRWLQGIYTWKNGQWLPTWKIKENLDDVLGHFYKNAKRIMKKYQFETFGISLIELDLMLRLNALPAFTNDIQRRTNETYRWFNQERTEAELFTPQRVTDISQLFALCLNAYLSYDVIRDALPNTGLRNLPAVPMKEDGIQTILTGVYTTGKFYQMDQREDEYIPDISSVADRFIYSENPYPYKVDVVGNVYINDQRFTYQHVDLSQQKLKLVVCTGERYPERTLPLMDGSYYYTPAIFKESLLYQFQSTHILYDILDQKIGDNIDLSRLSYERIFGGYLKKRLIDSYLEGVRRRNQTTFEHPDHILALSNLAGFIGDEEVGRKVHEVGSKTFMFVPMYVKRFYYALKNFGAVVPNPYWVTASHDGSVRPITNHQSQAPTPIGLNYEYYRDSTYIQVGFIETLLTLSHWHLINTGHTQAPHTHFGDVQQKMMSRIYTNMSSGVNRTALTSLNIFEYFLNENGALKTINIEPDKTPRTTWPSYQKGFLSSLMFSTESNFRNYFNQYYPLHSELGANKTEEMTGKGIHDQALSDLNRKAYSLNGFRLTFWRDDTYGNDLNKDSFHTLPGMDNLAWYDTHTRVRHENGFYSTAWSNTFASGRDIDLKYIMDDRYANVFNEPRNALNDVEYETKTGENLIRGFTYNGIAHIAGSPVHGHYNGNPALQNVKPFKWHRDPIVIKRMMDNLTDPSVSMYDFMYRNINNHPYGFYVNPLPLNQYTDTTGIAFNRVGNYRTSMLLLDPRIDRVSAEEIRKVGSHLVVNSRTNKNDFILGSSRTTPFIRDSDMGVGVIYPFKPALFQTTDWYIPPLPTSNPFSQLKNRESTTGLKYETLGRKHPRHPMKNSENKYLTAKDLHRHHMEFNFTVNKPRWCTLLEQYLPGIVKWFSFTDNVNGANDKPVRLYNGGNYLDKFKFNLGGASVLTTGNRRFAGMPIQHLHDSLMGYIDHVDFLTELADDRNYGAEAMKNFYLKNTVDPMLKGNSDKPGWELKIVYRYYNILNNAHTHYDEGKKIATQPKYRLSNMYANATLLNRNTRLNYFRNFIIEVLKNENMIPRFANKENNVRVYAPFYRIDRMLLDIVAHILYKKYFEETTMMRNAKTDDFLFECHDNTVLRYNPKVYTDTLDLLMMFMFLFPPYIQTGLGVEEWKLKHNLALNSNQAYNINQSMSFTWFKPIFDFDTFFQHETKPYTASDYLKHDYRMTMTTGMNGFNNLVVRRYLDTQIDSLSWVYGNKWKAEFKKMTPYSGVYITNLSESTNDRQRITLTGGKPVTFVFVHYAAILAPNLTLFNEIKITNSYKFTEYTRRHPFDFQASGGPSTSHNRIRFYDAANRNQYYNDAYLLNHVIRLEEGLYLFFYTDDSYWTAQQGRGLTLKPYTSKEIEDIARRDSINLNV